MNLTLHQFKTDTFHFRWRLVGFWLSFTLGPVLNHLHSLPGAIVGIFSVLLDLWQIFFSLGIVTALVQADPLVGASAAWLTRPVRRANLFWAKSAFILLYLFLPWMAVRGLDWYLRGYSWPLGLEAAAESLLYSVPFVLTIAVLAALTRNGVQFFCALGLALGLMFVWVVVVDALVHWHVLHHPHLDWVTQTEIESTALAVALVVLAVFAFIAWLFQARAGLSRPASFCLAFGLMIFPVVTASWSLNFLAPHLSPSAPVTLSLFDTNRPAVSTGQWLSTELLLDGVPQGQVAVIQTLDVLTHFKGNHTTLSIANPALLGHGADRARPWNSPAKDDYLHVIQGVFPAATLWFKSDYYASLTSALETRDIYKKFNERPPASTLNGHTSLDLYQVQKVADLPLRETTFLALPGIRVSVQKIAVANETISLSLDESFARLMFDRNVNTARPGNYTDNEPFCTYILYHPSSGEAFVVPQENIQSGFPGLLGGETHQSLFLSFPYPLLREKLAGITAADWLRDARLCVFAPVYAGTSRLAFDREAYHWPAPSARDAHSQKQNDDVVAALSRVTLPAEITPATLNAYINEILLDLPDYPEKPLVLAARQKLAALGTNGVPVLLQRLPLTRLTEDSIVFPVIQKLLTRDQLPELRDALQRDDNVVNLFREMKWEADARDILLAKLPDHRQVLPAPALRLAAEAKDPATYADLRWQFVHLSYGHDQVIAALEQCPGFDVTNAVREAWQLAQLGVTDTHDLAAIAARQNLPDALNTAVVVADQDDSKRSRQNKLSQLASLTGYNGPTNETLAWLTANLTHFKYDPANQRYTLEPVQVH